MNKLKRRGLRFCFVLYLGSLARLTPPRASPQICSRSLFEDMQAKFRSETNLAAERIKMETQKLVTEER